jgi:predicted NACHT family NTPase
MDPLTLATTILSNLPWQKILSSVAEDQIKSTPKSGLQTTTKKLLSLLPPTEQEKSLRLTLQLFTESFLTELDDKLDLQAALPRYKDQLTTLLSTAAPDIAAHLHPEVKEIDLSPVRRQWEGHSLPALPHDFDWSLVAKDYARALRNHIMSDPTLRDQLNTALLEQSTKAITHLVGPQLSGYRQHLSDRCNLLQLSSLNTTNHKDPISLWSIFVPQTAREQDRRTRRLTFKHSPLNPILDILQRHRHVVVLGHPGSGKTSLLKYLSLRWIQHPTAHPLPLCIDCKEYQPSHPDLLTYISEGNSTYKLDAQFVETQLEAGQAALYLDGLDEIAHAPTRDNLTEELAAFATRYPQAPIIVTSRIIGYEPNRLLNAKFTHTTLEDFDDAQVATFIQNWYQAADDDPEERIRLETQLTQNLKQSPAGRQLAGNPLRLTLLAILNRNQALPRDRVELYAHASNLLPLDSLARRSFLEYNRAAHFVERLEKQQTLTLNQLKTEVYGTHWQDENWHEVLRLIAAMVGEKQAEALIQYLIEQDGKHHKLANLFLAAECLGEVRNRQAIPATDAQLEQVFQKEVIRYEAPYFVEWYEEERELGPTREKAVHHLATYWPTPQTRQWLRSAAVSDHDWIIRIAALRELVRGWKDAPDTQDLLQQRARRDEEHSVRRAALEELIRAWKHAPGTQELLQDLARYDENDFLRQNALEELASTWKGAPGTCELLQDRARNDEYEYVRWAGVQQLARGCRETPGTLELLHDRARDDEDEYVRRAAVQELARGYKDTPGTQELLQDLARNDEDDSVRQAAVQELARGWRDTPGTLEWLQDRASNDENEWVRKAAVQELTRGWPDRPFL